MKIAIIAAMHEECQYLRSQFNQSKEQQQLGIKFSVNIYNEHQLIIVESGIAKVNAALSCQKVIDIYQPDLIINTGSAGGIKNSCQIGDFVIANKVCHHDIDVSPIGFKFGELPRLPVYYKIRDGYLTLIDTVAKELNINHHIGTIATGEMFVYENNLVNRINERFNNVIACEMEAAAVAQVCHLNKIPFVVIRSLSDIAGHKAPANFEMHLKQASKLSSQLVLNFIQQLGE